MPASDAPGLPVADVAGMPSAVAATSTAASVPPDGAPSAGRAWFRFLRSELRLMLSRRRNQAGLGVLAALPVIMAVAVKIASPSAGSGEGPSFLSQIVGNGFFVALTALGVEVGLFLPLAVAMLAGDALAGEAQIGTLRGLLVAPVGRTRLLVTKYVGLVLGGLIGTLVVAVAGLLAGAALFGLHPVVTISGTTLSLGEGLLRLLLVVLYVAAFLAALAAIGLFISTLTDQPLGATVALALLSTTMWILDAIPQLDWLHPWLLVDRQVAFADLLRDPVYWADMRLGLLTDLAYVVVFGLAAWARFANKDITG